MLKGQYGWPLIELRLVACMQQLFYLSSSLKSFCIELPISPFRPFLYQLLSCMGGGCHNSLLSSVLDDHSVQGSWDHSGLQGLNQGWLYIQGMCPTHYTTTMAPCEFFIYLTANSLLDVCFKSFCHSLLPFPLDDGLGVGCSEAFYFTIYLSSYSVGAM